MGSTTCEGDDGFGLRSEPSSLVVGSDDWPVEFSIAKADAQGRWEGYEFALTRPGWASSPICLARGGQKMKSDVGA